MTFEEFKTMWETEAKTELGAIKMYLIGILELVTEENKYGNKMIAMCVHKDEFNEDFKPRSSQQFYIGQFAKKVKGTDYYGAIAASYLGGTHENGYKYDYKNALVEKKAGTSRGEKETKIFIQSGGKDNPTPVSLKKNKYGYWKLICSSSLCTGVKDIKSDDF
ncbi:hypothetical protein KAU33_14085 [Candidatus Dependentiae bacterium]|nr:hypothetical protein [Candidatus Dependentiae bacterium]